MLKCKTALKMHFGYCFRLSSDNQTPISTLLSVAVAANNAQSMIKYSPSSSLYKRPNKCERLCSFRSLPSGSGKET